MRRGDLRLGREHRVASSFVLTQDFGDQLRSRAVGVFVFSVFIGAYLDDTGQIAWKASPWMLSRLADAEREVEDDMADFP